METKDGFGVPTEKLILTHNDFYGRQGSSPTTPIFPNRHKIQWAAAIVSYWIERERLLIDAFSVENAHEHMIAFHTLERAVTEICRQEFARCGVNAVFLIPTDLATMLL